MILACMSMNVQNVARSFSSLFPEGRHYLIKRTCPFPKQHHISKYEQRKANARHRKARIFRRAARQPTKRVGHHPNGDPRADRPYQGIEDHFKGLRQTTETVTLHIANIRSRRRKRREFMLKQNGFYIRFDQQHRKPVFS